MEKHESFVGEEYEFMSPEERKVFQIYIAQNHVQIFRSL
jgi:hypothetical protein